MKKISRLMDVMVAKLVYGAIVKDPHQENGWRIDYLSLDPKCNRDIVTDHGVDAVVLKSYTTEMADTISLIDEMVTKSWIFTINHTGSRYISSFRCGAGARGRYHGTSSSLSKSVVKAALQAVSVYPHVDLT